MFVRVNGITMHVQVRGEVGAPPVLLLHSLGTALQLWDGVAELLSARFRPVQIDLRGHGLTSVPRGCYTIDDMAVDVVGALEAMDIAEVHVVGVSLGGAVAQRLGVMLRGRVRSLVLLGTATSFPPSDFWLNRAAAVRNAGIEQFIELSVARWVSDASLGTPAADGLRAMLRRTDPQGYAASAEALAAVNLAEDAGSLDLPTLVMVGEADHSTPIGTATGLRDAISGARLKTLPGLAHLPPAEAPALVAAAIVEFLDSVPRQTASTDGEDTLASEKSVHVTTHDARGAKLSEADEARCQQILADWMAALNAHDAARMDSFLRFPHVRVAANNVTVYGRPGDNPMDVFRKLIDEQDWHHSAWTHIHLVQSSPNKAHYAVQYTRYRADGSVIGVFDSLYVFTCIHGDWKIQVRSSFGP